MSAVRSIDAYTLVIEPDEDKSRIVLLDPEQKETDEERLDFGLSLFRRRIADYIREIAGHKAGAAAFEEEPDSEPERLAAQVESQLAALGRALPAKEGGNAQVTVVLHLNEGEYPVTVTQRIAAEVCVDLTRRLLDCAEEVCDRNPMTAALQIHCPGENLMAMLAREGLQRRFEGVSVTGAGQPSAGEDEAKTTEAAAFSYGILLAEDYESDPNKTVIQNIILKGSPLPASGSLVCYAARSSHSLLWFDVYRTDTLDQRFDGSAPEKTFLGRAEFMTAADLSDAPALTCRLELSETGVLTASVSDENSNFSSTVKFSLSNPL